MRVVDPRREDDAMAGQAFDLTRLEQMERRLQALEDHSVMPGHSMGHRLMATIQALLYQPVPLASAITLLK